MCACVHVHALAHTPVLTNLPVPLASQSTLHSGEVNSLPEKSDCFSISILMSRFVKSLQEREKITGSS